MSDSENLFRVTKHINTHITSLRIIQMKVYDIVNEVRSVGKGDYAGFVWDQPPGSRNITVTFPDGRSTTVTNQADAKRVADEWRNRLAARTGANNQPADSPETAKRREQLKSVEERGRKAYNSAKAKFYSPTNWIFAALSSAGISLAVYQSLDDRMYELYVQHNIYPEDHELYINAEEYKYAATAYYAFWASTTLLPALKALLSTRAAVRSLISAIRAANISAAAVRQGLSAVSGPGFLAAALVNALWILLSEVALYFAARLILSNETIKNGLADAIVGWLYNSFSAVFNTSETIHDFLAKTSSGAIGRISQSAAQEAESDVRALVGLNPADAFDRRDREIPRPNNSPANQNNHDGSTAGPSSRQQSNNRSQQTATPPSNADLGIAPNLR